jgi:competence protein ComEC
VTQTTVTFVDVGQGDCTVAVDRETHQAVVIDCSAGGVRFALEHLSRESTEELVAAIATHNDLDHLGGLYELAQEANASAVHLNHGTVVHSDVPRRTQLTAALRAFADLEDRGVALEGITAGAVRTIGAIRLLTLAPTHGQITRAQGRRQPNLASAVIRLESRGHVVLIAGDAPADTWTRLLDAGADLAADILLFPHHGAELPPALMSRLLDSVAASFFLISVGTRNPYGHPAVSTLEALAAARGRLLCTQVNRNCLHGGPLPRTEATEALPESALGEPASLAIT